MKKFIVLSLTFFTSVAILCADGDAPKPTPLVHKHRLDTKDTLIAGLCKTQTDHTETPVFSPGYKSPQHRMIFGSTESNSEISSPSCLLLERPFGADMAEDRTPILIEQCFGPFEETITYMMINNEMTIIRPKTYASLLLACSTSGNRKREISKPKTGPLYIDEFLKRS
ncbi:hypothetical protein EBR77_04320 [bacterium]|nr:hypothetical protein [bacterium]NBX78467.1 hypothetical protein [bacterium]